MGNLIKDRAKLIQENAKLTIENIELKKSLKNNDAQIREILEEFCCVLEFDVKHETYEEDINYFLQNEKART